MRLKTSFEIDRGVNLEVADFRCDGCLLAASLFVPERSSRTGVLVVVGGPQYRVGGHRQYVDVARHTAAAGHPTLIFDHRGCGDSEGEPRAYFELDRDIRAAVDALMARQPELEGVVLWSLCDGATASVLYARHDPRILGLILVNPWLEPNRSHAHSRLKDYYGARLASRTFWRDLLQNPVTPVAAMKDVLGEALRALGLRPSRSGPGGSPSSGEVASAAAVFSGPIHLILSGRDVTARAFARELEHHADWRALREQRNVSRCDVPDADHTFSRSVWNEQLLEETLHVLARLERAPALPDAVTS